MSAHKNTYKRSNTVLLRSLDNFKVGLLWFSRESSSSRSGDPAVNNVQSRAKKHPLPTSPFINHIHVLYPLGSVAVQIVPTNCEKGEALTVLRTGFVASCITIVSRE
jgi:hypothetical protein